MKQISLVFLIGIICTSCTQIEKSFLESKDAYFGLTPPGSSPEIFAPGIVSDTSWAEHCQIAISPRGDEIFWSVYTDEFKTEDGKRSTEQLYYSRLQNGVWTIPSIADFTTDNKHGGNGGPVFSLDGKKLFFYQRKPRDKYMYYVEKVDDQWSKPIKVGEPFNTKEGNVASNWTPVFTKNGNAYKYDQKERVILKYRYDNVKFSQPDTMRIQKDFTLAFNVYFAPDESYYIFSGYNYKGKGDLDLCICFKDQEGNWGYPIIMRDEINTEARERFPVVSPDGKYLFFMRHTKTQDVFWISTKVLDKYKKESIEAMKKPPIFKAIKLKPEVLDKYTGVYSCAELTRNITIFNEEHKLKVQFGDRQAFTMDCYDTNKFKYDPGMLRAEFLPDKNKMVLHSGSKTFEMLRE